MSASHISSAQGCNGFSNGILILNTQLCASVVLPHLCSNFHLTKKLNTSLPTFYPGLVDQKQDLCRVFKQSSIILLC